jgi:N-acetylmuramoyl-L-alanine amidase
MRTKEPRRLNAALAELAKTFLVCVLCVLSVPLIRAATPPVRTMYNDAFAHEQAVRATLAGADVPQSAAQEARAVVAAYEAVVKHYPASSYCDNALWQGAHLALDAFDKFGQPQDRETGMRLLRRLATMYPSSKLAKQVPNELKRLDADASLLVAHASSLDNQPPTSREQRATINDSRPALAVIKAIRRSVLPEAVRVTIELDAEVPFHDERLSDPVRVFVDLSGTRAAPNLVDQTLRFEGDADVVRQVRVGRHPNNTTRVVLDAAGVGSYSVYPLYGPFRIVIDCVRPATTTAATTGVSVAGPAPSVAKPRASEMIPLPGRRLTTEWLRKAPSVPPQHGVLLTEAKAFVEAPPPAPKIADLAPMKPLATPTPVAPPPNLQGGLSMARQLGLGVSRIVIDPGHGGHDPGAKGKGVSEAELVLDVALRLEKLLQKVPGVEVILTRRTDDFIALPERTAIANRENADLFLSIHANASPNPQAHGIETYFLNFANNQSAAAVAARENAASTQAMGELPDFVKAIARNTKLEESHDFATHVQRAMVDKLRGSNKAVKDLGVKQAPFVVLIGAVMPSVLAEISFVTNPQEAKLVKANAYRQRIADALFNAIRKYQTSLKNVGTVALQ